MTTTDATTARDTAAALHGLYRTTLLTAPWPLTDDGLDALRNSAAAHARAVAHRNAVEAAAAERALWSVFVHACGNRSLYDAVTRLAPVWGPAKVRSKAATG
ncbi:FCD domain-containing protein [Streptomyces albofaciens]|uniref:FCD domain-containing protein n=1 Tax=Streptomyces albofaciens TaxID=66866 RepID=UPI00142EF51B|nr:FCD domain-containing protein [Streptomyces albofaciens]